jgi:hypothetical protein
MVRMLPPPQAMCPCSAPMHRQLYREPLQPQIPRRSRRESFEHVRLGETGVGTEAKTWSRLSRREPVRGEEAMTKADQSETRRFIHRGQDLLIRYRADPSPREVGRMRADNR